MTDLRTAAQQALEAMDKATRFMSNADYKKLNQAIEELRAALAEPVQEPVALNDGRLWQYPDGSIGIGSAPPQRPAEPVQEPVWVCPDSAEHRYQKPGHCEDCGKTLVQVAEPVQQGCDHCNRPLYAAVKCRVCGRSHGAE